MDDSTVIMIILILGNLNMLCAIIVGVKKRSLLWGIFAWLFAPLVLLGLLVLALGSGRRELPNPQPYGNNRMYYN